MRPAARLGAYVVGLAVVFAAALGVGNAVGAIGAAGSAASRARTASADGHGDHGAGERRNGEAAARRTDAAVPGGLAVSERGYTFTPTSSIVAAGEERPFRFGISGPDGAPVTRFAREHDKELHLIVVRRDLSGFQHLHPTRDAAGTWSVPLRLPAAGDYCVFADFVPAGGPGLTLGADLHAAGRYGPRPVPPASRTAQVDGYQVTLRGTLRPGVVSDLTLTVTRGGRPVADLQPYLGAYGHLVALRRGDLAYLHVHPRGEPGDGVTAPGPDIGFAAEVPTAGTYRLYLDFRHDGAVRTAEFTAVAGEHQGH